ncbi:hypothetical protein HETIRDRAFT_314046 [Heterobasidion irregulare TC 32-1]|uniref:Uncharacterized protein n=1 Tax=Heterobasidion irregulare (strain TC 32-1) TaxID=747525 RepID=W4KGA6_HETIT|nr:uncharacterized protein HETIRDRAFT_314046 [Heterobasidion irregulare TC 32-1]ETW84759.1 hypothetical protein HETIRDRAFT_314046 [Heterobasidion irregulare TC 32-1]
MSPIVSPAPPCSLSQSLLATTNVLIANSKRLVHSLLYRDTCWGATCASRNPVRDDFDDIACSGAT